MSATGFPASGGIVEHSVYTISGAANLVTIPFADLRKPKLLNAREELRNGYYKFNDGGFDFEAGIYEPQDPECCLANGAYHAHLKLEGGSDRLMHTVQHLSLSLSLLRSGVREIESVKQRLHSAQNADYRVPISGAVLSPTTAGFF